MAVHSWFCSQDGLVLFGRRNVHPTKTTRTKHASSSFPALPDAMMVSTLQMRILIREARSLKDKRRIVKSIVDRLRGRFNVSVAEIEHRDSVRTCTLGVALVGTDRRTADGTLQQVLTLVRSTPGAELSTFDMEL